MIISDSVKKCNTKSHIPLFSVLVLSAVMKTISQIRRENLELLIEGTISKTARELSERCEVSAAYLSQIKGEHKETKTGKPKTMGDDIARRLEAGMGKPEGWMDQDRSESGGNTELGPDIRGKVPLISWVQAGNFAQVIDNLQPGDAEEMIPTSVPIHKHTYALRVKGDSMKNPDGDPTFPHGSVIIVEPDAIDSPDKLVGALVIVRKERDDEATFKKLVRDAGRFYLMPLNPQFPRLDLTEGDTLCGVVRSREQRFF